METRITGQALSALKKEVAGFNAQLRQRQNRTGSENLDKDAFLRLLTIQISKQDPLSPMKNTEFVAQMAQFTALEQMKNMNTSMGELKRDIAVMPMFSMIGKEISYYDEANETYVTGQAEGVLLDRTGEPMIVVDDKRVGLEYIVSVRERMELPSIVAGQSIVPGSPGVKPTNPTYATIPQIPPIAKNSSNSTLSKSVKSVKSVKAVQTSYEANIKTIGSASSEEKVAPTLVKEPSQQLTSQSADRVSRADSAQKSP